MTISAIIHINFTYITDSYSVAIQHTYSLYKTVFNFTQFNSATEGIPHFRTFIPSSGSTVFDRIKLGSCNVLIDSLDPKSGTQKVNLGISLPFSSNLTGPFYAEPWTFFIFYIRPPILR